MTKSNKIGLGILTFLPVASFLLYFVFFFFMFFGIMNSINTLEARPEDLSPSLFAGGFSVVFFLFFIGILAGIGLMIYYIIHANKNPKFDSNDKLLWILVLVLAGIIGNVIYFFVHIVPAETTTKIDA